MDNGFYMPFAASAAQRYVLFQSLYDASQSQDHNWDQVVALLSRGAQTAQRAHLDSLAQQFADGQQVVMDELREGGLFREWELQFMRLGLAVGNLARVYLRLAEHYRFQVECHQRLLRRLVGVAVAAVLLASAVPLCLSAVGVMPPALVLSAVVYGTVPLLVLASLVAAALLHRGLRAALHRVLYRLPGVGTALAQYQHYHYINHLAECVGADFQLHQALTQSARRMPDTPVKSRYYSVANSVEKGNPLSAALLAAGVLEGVNFAALPSGLAPGEVPAQLGLAMHRRCQRNLRFWARAVPDALMLACTAYVLSINAWFLWR